MNRLLLLVGLDLYNALNVNPVIALNGTYNAVPTATPTAAWLAPQSILTARFVKFSVQLDF